MNKWLRGGAALGLAAVGSVALAGPGSTQEAPLRAEVTTPQITPLEHALFQSIDPCLDPTVEGDAPGRIVVDVALGEAAVFSYEQAVEEDGHWASEVFMETDDDNDPATPGTPAPLDVGTYRLAVRCLPLDPALTEPVQNYVPLEFTVVSGEPAPAPEPEPEPAPPVVEVPTGGTG